MYALRKQFVMLQSEIEAYKALPHNLPDTHLAKWERNEYLTLKSDYEKEIAEPEAHISLHKHLFEKLT